MPSPTKNIPDTSRNDTDYSTDLTDPQWEIVASLLPPPDTSGRLPKTNLRHAVNAMLYRRKTGCPRAMLPRDFGVPPRTALWWFAKFARLGVWPTIQEAMIGPTREACGRAAEPELVSIDFPRGEVRGISARDSERCECDSLANA